ncbi:hypothetical protein SAMN02910447_00348, partial [Ruminococcus sp. YE71]|uniref:isopeptide-forming domain-containing fimbrial protein n=1 Tax=unclassified Ruminococcus TaxID=2608920 RepID=UPI000891779B
MSKKKTLSSRILSTLTSALMVFTTLPADMFSIRAGAADNWPATVNGDTDITQYFHVNSTGVQDAESGDEIGSGATLHNGQVLSLGFSWDSSEYMNHDPFELEFSLGINTDVVDCQTSEAHVQGFTCDGDYTISDGTVTIDATPKNDRYDNFRGSYEAFVVVDVDKDDLDANGCFSFSYLGETYTFRLAPQGLDIKKTSGELVIEGDDIYQTFSVSVKPEGGTPLKNVTLIDKLDGERTDLFKSIDASSVKVVSNGGEDLTSSADITFTGPSDEIGQFNMVLPEVPGDGVVLTYRVKLNKDYLADCASGQKYATQNNAISAYDEMDLHAGTSYAGVTVEKATFDKSAEVQGDKIHYTLEFHPNDLDVFLGITDHEQITVSDCLTVTKGDEKLYGGDIDDVVLTYDSAAGCYRAEYDVDIDKDNWVAQDKNVKATNDAKFVYGGENFEDETTTIFKKESTGIVGGTGKSIVSTDDDSITWKIEVEIPEDTGDLATITIEDNVFDETAGPSWVTSKSDPTLTGGFFTDAFTYTVDGTVIPSDQMKAYTGTSNYTGYYGWVSGNSDQADEIAKSSDFNLVLNKAFLTDYAGKTLTITYTTKLNGQVTDTYTNTVKAVYTTTDNETGEFTDSATKKSEITGFKRTGQSTISGYSAANDKNGTTFWEFDIYGDANYKSGDVIKVVDTLPECTELVNGTVMLQTNDKYISGLDVYNTVTWTDLPDWMAAQCSFFNDCVTTSVKGRKVTFTITLTDELIASYKARGNVMALGYALQLTEEGRIKMAFDEGLTLVNTADVYLNDKPQAEDITSTQTLTSDGNKLIDKKDGEYKQVETDKGLYVTTDFTIKVNPEKKKLSENGKIFVDDWLGGNYELPETVSINGTVYTVKKTDDGDNSQGTVAAYFYKDGKKVEGWSVTRTGPGKKMTFALDDETAYTISYSCLIQTMDKHITLSKEEEMARYSNTAVVRGSGSDSQSSSTVVDSDDYGVSATIEAGSMEGYIIINIEKDWNGDDKSIRPDHFTLNVEKTELDAKGNPTGVSTTFTKLVKLNDNAVEEADGKWLVTLKFKTLEYNEATGSYSKYAYSIDENQLSGYKVNSWVKHVSSTNASYDSPENLTTTAEQDSSGSGAIFNYTLTNQKDETQKITDATVEFSKTDITGENEIAGAKLAVYKAEDIGANGKPLSGKAPVDSWVSDGTAHAAVLTEGDYVLMETGVEDSASKYKVVDSAVSFTVESGKVKNVSGTVDKDSVTSKDKESGYVLYTEGTDTTNAKFTVCDAEKTFASVEITKVDNDGKALEGAVVTVTADREIETSDITVTESDTGKPLDFTTGTKGGCTYIKFTTASGTAVIGGLTQGKYTVTEIVPPDGYTVNPAANGFEVDASNKVKGSGVIDIVDDMLVININKTDLTGKNEVHNAVLTITNDSLSEYQWAQIADSSSGVQMTTYGDGITWTSGDSEVQIVGLPNGTYTLTETQGEEKITDDNGNVYDVLTSDVIFTIDNSKADFLTVTNAKSDFDKTAEEAYAVASGDTITICDALRKFGTVSVSKTEMAGGDEIEGATLKIETTADTSNVVLTRDGKNLTEGSDYTVETKNGKTTITFTTGSTKTFVTGLAEGSYTLTETIAPDGYVINESTFDFTVNSKGEVSKSAIEVIDEAVKLSVNKTDLTGKTEVQNAVLTITNSSLTAEQWAEIASANAGVKLTANGDGITWTSGKSAVEIKYLLNGTYTLTETQGEKVITDADGNKYDVLASEVTFVVDNTKNDVVKVTDAKTDFASDATEGYAVFDGDTLTICDALRKFGTVSVSKTEMAGGDEIEGAKLKIETTADTSCLVLMRGTSVLIKDVDYTVKTAGGKTVITFVTGTTKTIVTGL